MLAWPREEFKYCLGKACVGLSVCDCVRVYIPAVASPNCTFANPLLQHFLSPQYSNVRATNWGSYWERDYLIPLVFDRVMYLKNDPKILAVAT